MEVKLSWGTMSFDNVSMERAYKNKDYATIIIRNDIERVEDLIRSMEHNSVFITFEDINCQIIYPHCRLIESEVNENFASLVVDYGAAN